MFELLKNYPNWIIDKRKIKRTLDDTQITIEDIVAIKHHTVTDDKRIIRPPPKYHYILLAICDVCMYICVFLYVTNRKIE